MADHTRPGPGLLRGAYQRFELDVAFVREGRRQTRRRTDSSNYDPWVLLAMQCFEREIDEEQKKDMQSQTQMELAASYAMLIAPAARNRAMR
ncbi:hypothetical protein [Rhizobium rhizogenes]